MKWIVIVLGIVLCGDLSAQKSRAFTVGTTATDWCLTGTYHRLFYGKKGKIGEFVYGNGYYVTVGKGRYAYKSLHGAKDHRKVGLGFKWGSYWMEKDWWPALDIGVSFHEVSLYDGFERKVGAPVFNKWSLDFGSSAQIKWFYSGVLVNLSRQLEMTMSFGVVF